MQTFLNQLAIHSIQKYPNNLGDLTLVLPNRRAIVFLKEAFKQNMKKGGWLPTFYSLEDFISTIGEYQQLDSIDLIFELFQIHKEVEKVASENFEDFMSWGTTLLQDFNEIDRYLVNGKELFSFLTEAKALEIWELEGGGLTEFQHKYLKFWTKLGLYYKLFTEKLKAKNQVYQGLGFRMVAEKLMDKTLIPKNIENIIFAGFNALTAAEKEIINYFEINFDGEVIWDADEYYLDDSFQEAGNFLRQYKIASKNNFSWISNHLVFDSKKIEIFGVNGNIGQAKLIGNLLNESTESSAVVLSDEELLIPVLEALPHRKLSTNVTMGYPLSSSPIYSWIESWLNLYLNNSQDGGLENLYHQDLKGVINHSVSQYFNSSIIHALSEVNQEIETGKSIFIPLEKLNNLNSLFKIQLFQKKSVEPQLLISNLLELVGMLRKQGLVKLDLLAQECLSEVEKSFIRLQNIANNSKDLSSLKALVEIYKQVVSAQSVSFVGEPLGGIQIMGVLESRTLDFENVLISSVNEGILPSGKTQNSFIPFDIKKKFLLPSYQEKDAIFAYHFYRLLQRAKSIKILYNTKVDQLQGGERSRFIEQLVHEFQTKNKNSKLIETIVSPSPKSISIERKEIKSNSKIVADFKYKAENKLSASALNTFLECPLNFYFRYSLKLNEDSSFDEKVQDNTLGTVVHNSLQDIYTPYLGKVLIDNDFKNILLDIDAVIQNNFENEVNTKAEFGNHKLTFEVSKKFVLNQLNFDRNIIRTKNELIILKVEEEFSHSFILPNSENKVTLFGKVDRIDSVNGNKRVIDYKTGSVELNDLKYRDIDSLKNGSKSKAIQLMLYKYMLEKQLKISVEVGIISLRKISNGFMAFNKDGWEEDFLTTLDFAINSMYNSPFILHKKESKYCTFC